MTSSKTIKSLTLLASLLLAVMAFGPVLAQVDEAPTRDQIEDKYKWDLRDFYPSDEAWEDAFKALEARIPDMEKYKGKLGSGDEILYECLNMSDSMSILAHRLYVYANLKQDEDNRVGKYQEMSDRIRQLYSSLSQATSYIEPEILTIPYEKVEKFMAKNPKLAIYRFYLEDMFRRQAHVLSAKEENILALAGPATSGPGKIFRMMDDADIKFGNVIDEDGNEIELTRGRYSLLLQSSNREVRRQASETYNDAYKGYINTLGATLASSVDGDLFYTKARGYNNCLDRSLDGNNIPISVFYNLIETVSNNLEPLHKYTALRKKALGVDTLFGFDMYVPLVEDVKKEYTVEEARGLVLEALKPLGKEYLSNLEMGLDSRWVDFYETQGKGSGGYSWGTYSVHPVVLLNFTGSLDNVFTLAHEMGHAMHSYYTNANEPYVYAGHSLFTAEVASTCNEALMIKYMLDRAKDRNEKLYLLNYYIDQIIGTFYVQVFFSEFELKIHEIVENGGALSPDKMREIYREIYQKYYGSDYFIPEGRDLGCLRIGHFYRMYYVYQYATSYAASQMLSRMIMEGKPGAQQAYLDFVKTGTSAYPIDILKRAGIDMTTSTPVEYTLKIFSELVDQFEALLLEGK
nr:oligoendopeptidase F [candidate division Zixibacteria bacterium]